MILKKCQAGLEFIALLSIALIFFLAIISFLSYQNKVITENQVYMQADSILERVSREILIAQRITGNYNRTFEIPNTIADNEYNISIFRGKELILIEENGREFFKTLPFYIYGDIMEGENIIKKNGNSIGICWDNCNDDYLFNYSSQLQCMDEHDLWENCDFKYNQKIYGIRTDYTTPPVEINISNINDSKVFFSETSNSPGTDFTEFIFEDYLDEDYITINESGYWDVTVNDNYNPSKSFYYFVPYGEFVFEPLSVNGCVESYGTYNCTKYENFTITSTIKCIGGECGDVKQWLDPQ